MKRAKHSLSHYKLASMDMGELVPLACYEVLPGDTIQQQTQALIRVSPLLAPVMHPVRVRIHHWYVPTRLIWDDFENFITGGPDNNDASVPPYRDFGSGANHVGSLNDYLGIPTGVITNGVSILPHRAYSLIWNEWYRDQDLQTPLVISKASGADATTNVTLQNAGWEKDMYTSARPWPQKGPDVLIPLGNEAPVLSDGTQPKGRGAGGVYGALITSGSPNPNIQVTGTSAGAFDWGADGASETGLFADLSAATSIGIIELRDLLAQQRFAEARARFGSRYTEYLRYLGVRSSDARLQRPEYLGGGRQTIQFSEVLQTGVTTSGTPNIGVGEMRGHGISSMRSNRYRRFFEEHGYVITCMSVMPKTIYAQGVPRFMSRRVKEDYFQKEMAHIGQQEVLRKEIYAAAASPDGVFGYQDRYDEYRRIESGIAGEFRTSDLNFWHMARLFGSEPALNADFVKGNPTKRVNAVQNKDVLYVMAHHSIQARRIVPKFGSSFTY